MGSGCIGSWDLLNKFALPVMQTECSFYVGDIITGMGLIATVTGKSNTIICVTISGSVKKFTTISKNSDFVMFSSLELMMRQEAYPILGRDHISFRSYGMPVRNVVDGDLLEMFFQFSKTDQKVLSSACSSQIHQIERKIEALRLLY